VEQRGKEKGRDTGLLPACHPHHGSLARIPGKRHYVRSIDLPQESRALPELQFSLRLSSDRPPNDTTREKEGGNVTSSHTTNQPFLLPGLNVSDKSHQSHNNFTKNICEIMFQNTENNGLVGYGLSEYC